MTNPKDCIGNIASDGQRNIARIKGQEEVVITESLRPRDPSKPCQLDNLFSTGLQPGETRRACENCGRYLQRTRI